MSHRVLIVVTHLLGTGHLARALVIARGFADAGDAVIVASGGMPAAHLNAEGVTLVQLPPLRSDGTDFAQLLGEDGAPASPDLLAARRALLTDLTRRHRPDILITELFPFGRRTLKDEFLGLLDAARDAPRPPRIFASVRDILAPPSKPRKAAFAEAVITEYYDAVLVHADPDVVRLEASWPVSDALRAKLRYTGFVAPALPSPGPDLTGAGEVLVSAGGGSVGGRLHSAALDAARGNRLRWRVLIGGHDAQERIAALRQDAPPNVLIEPARPDFRALLQRAEASISLCGYNTAMDVLQSGIPAVMAAFDDGTEVEQSLRASALSALPRLETLSLRTVSAPLLRSALDRVLADPAPRRTAFRFDGGERTRAICSGTVP